MITKYLQYYHIYPPQLELITSWSENRLNCTDTLNQYMTKSSMKKRKQGVPPISSKSMGIRVVANSTTSCLGSPSGAGESEPWGSFQILNDIHRPKDGTENTLQYRKDKNNGLAVYKIHLLCSFYFIYENGIKSRPGFGMNCLAVEPP